MTVSIEFADSTGTIAADFRDHARSDMLVVGNAANAQQRTDCEVTKAKYDRLQTGMTEAQAVKILGCHGIEMSSTDLGGIYTVMYMWTGNGIGNMNAMFQDNALVSKAQFGLE